MLSLISISKMGSEQVGWRYTLQANVKMGLGVSLDDGTKDC